VSVIQHVVHLDDIEPTRDGGSEVRVTFDSRNGCDRLTQRVLRLDAGSAHDRRTGSDQEVLYVASGRGSVTIDGGGHDLEPDTGVYVAPGTEYVIRADDDLTIVSVVAPDVGAASTGTSVVRFGEQEELDASPERSFRYLTDEGDLTQFIGIVQPSKAPFHSHPYDELGFIVEGQGVAHVGGAEIPLRAGSCFHLAPGEVHCIENSGTGPMRILGVFNPSDSPASRTYPDNN
jgi:mannose-6-phosphate isomerase-like protein (cupin superfamily)